MQLELGAIGAGAALVVALLGWLIYRKWFRLTELQRLVRDISHESLVNVFLPDGLGGEIHIDHVLLTPKGILVLDTKDVSGTIFAGDRLDEWSANAADGRVAFDNPLPQLQDRVSAIRQLVPGTPIEAKVLFTDEVTFPKGHPQAVSTIAELREAGGELPENSGLFESAWETIAGSARAV